MAEVKMDVMSANDENLLNNFYFMNDEQTVVSQKLGRNKELKSQLLTFIKFF